MAPLKIDDAYDLKAARVALQEFQSTRTTAKTAHLQLASFNKELPEHYDVVKQHNRANAVRLGMHVGDHAGLEEAVLRYQGVLFMFNLPPVKRLTRIDDTQRRFLAQTASVTGLGSEMFAKAHDGMFVCAERMSRHLDATEVPTWTAKKFHGYPGITASNRYYNYKGSNNPSPAVPFADVVDPLHTLRDMCGDDYEHTQDNEVLYMACVETDDGKLDYITKDPATFLPGDIVEVQVSLAEIRTRNGKVFFESVLRSLTLLSDEFSTAARIDQMKAESKRREQPAPVMKRKIGYCEDEIEVDRTRKFFQDMSISPRDDEQLD